MTIRINEHTRSVQRNLNKAVAETAEAQRALATGQRVNQASDDVAAFGMIERFTTQVRGYARAARNAYDGIGMAREAETSLHSAIDVIHHMKQLAIQAANDVNNREDRLALQDGMDGMMGELERIATHTDFAGLKLLDGSFLNRFLHIGAGFRESTSVTLRDARPSFLGRYAVMTTAAMGHEALERDEVQINGVAIRKTVEIDDQFSSTLRSSSAIAKAAAINDFTRFTGVSAHLQTTTREGVGEIQGGSLKGQDAFEINGVAFSGFEVEDSDRSQDLLKVINRQVHRTGVRAELNSKGRLKLLAEDGRNIEVRTTGNAHLVTGLRANVGVDVTTSHLSLVSEDVFRIDDAADVGNEAKIGAVRDAMMGVNLDQSVNRIDVTTRESANLAIEIVGRALEQLSRERSRLGGLENRLGFTIEQLNTAAQGAYHARGMMKDADVAKEAAKLAQGQIMREAFNNVLAQANAASQSALALI